MSAMKSYIAFGGDGPQDGAILVFAPTAREARKAAFPVIISDWMTEWIYCRLRRLRYLPAHLDALDNGTLQVIDAPPGCDFCDGRPLRIGGGSRRERFRQEWLDGESTSQPPGTAGQIRRDGTSGDHDFRRHRAGPYFRPIELSSAEGRATEEIVRNQDTRPYSGL